VLLRVKPPEDLAAATSAPVASAEEATNRVVAFRRAAKGSAATEER
jgi:hypothetical protein